MNGILRIFGASLCVAGALRAAEPMDHSALSLALSALRMTTADLSFKKDLVECEFPSYSAVLTLQSPLHLPDLAAQKLDTLKKVKSLEDLAGLGSIGVAPAQLNTPAVDLPEPLAGSVSRILSAAQTVAEVFSPVTSSQALAAFGVESLNLDGDAGEVADWERLGIEMKDAKRLIQRSRELDLQDAELAEAIIKPARTLNLALRRAAFVRLAGAVDQAIAELKKINSTAVKDTVLETPLGKVFIGGSGPNTYTEEAFLIMDVGGNDTYENSAGGANGLLGRPVSVVIDLAGNDRYVSRRSFSQGTGIFGVGILADLQGDDFYEANHLSQGAGFYGYGLLMDGGGQDTFRAESFAQGAGMFGCGILWQRGGDSRYHASQMAQGFGGVEGEGLLLEEAGNDLYFAGGKQRCPWLPGQYFSLSQGFGFGMRPFTGGGTGTLADLKGDDRYIADVYGQGASYWYAVGMLLDAEGNDFYQAYQYAQGAGIHLSSGILWDNQGDDQYTAHAICQGGAHDYSVGMLLDLAGNDRYMATSTAQGSAINNSFALLLDQAGNDFYAGRDPQQSQAAGHDGGRREYGSIGVLLDLAGADVYSQGQTNNIAWLKPWYGVGLDIEHKPQPAGARPSFFPSVRSVTATYRDIDTRHPLERLLRRSLRDEPGEAAAAWAELKQQGTNALAYLITRLDSPSVMVRARTEELVDHIGTNAAPVLAEGIRQSNNDDVARLCCYLLARFPTATCAIPAVLPLLDREKTVATAFYTLGHLKAREAFEPAIAALQSDREPVRLRAAQALGRIGEAKAIPALMTLLDDELWTVRYAAQDALVALGKPSVTPLRRAWPQASARAREHIVAGLAKLGDRQGLVWASELYRDQPEPVRSAKLTQLRDYLAPRR